MKRKYCPPKRDSSPLKKGRYSYRPYRQLTPIDCNFLVLPELGIEDPNEEILKAYKDMSISFKWTLFFEQELEIPTFRRNYCEV